LQTAGGRQLVLLVGVKDVVAMEGENHLGLRRATDRRNGWLCLDSGADGMG
jgi:hypothetical protein